MSRFGVWPWIVSAVAFAMMVFGSLTRDHGPGRRLLLEFCDRWERAAAEPVERRVALHGELLDADAGTHYREALWQVEGIRAKTRLGTDEEFALAAEPVAAMVAEVRRAVDGRWLERPLDGEGMTVRLCWVLRRQSERWLDTGRDEQGVALWLDAVAVAIDWGHSVPDGYGFIHNAGCAHAQAGDVWTAERLDRLDPGAGRHLANGLAVLEQRLVAGDRYERFFVHSARIVTSSDFDSVGPFAGWQTHVEQRLLAWRDGFSPQNAAIRELATLVAALPSLPPPDAPWQEFARGVAELAGSGIRARQLLDCEAARREALARIRLLRQALASRAGQPDDLHVDPFTGRAFDRETCGDRVYFVARHPGGDVHTHANLRAPAARR